MTFILSRGFLRKAPRALFVRRSVWEGRKGSRAHPAYGGPGFARFRYRSNPLRLPDRGVIRQSRRHRHGERLFLFHVLEQWQYEARQYILQDFPRASSPAVSCEELRKALRALCKQLRCAVFILH
jgi:hypothetical protein